MNAEPTLGIFAFYNKPNTKVFDEKTYSHKYKLYL